MAVNLSTPVPQSVWKNEHIASDADIAATKTINRYAIKYQQLERKSRHQVRSESFNLDDNATVDRVLLRPSSAITITAARIVYDDATTGTVAGGSMAVGTTVGGGEIVAATNYENATAVGATTAMSIVSGAVAAGTPVIVRHIGVAATQAGHAVIELEYTVDNEADEVASVTVPIHVAKHAGTIVSIEVSCITAPTGSDSFTVDLKKGNQSTAFATVLSGTISYSATQADREVEAGTLVTLTYDAGDTLQLVITATTTTTQGAGVCVTVVLDENPS